MEIVKEMIFQGKPFNEDNREHMIIELGDIMWYVAQACMALGVTLDDVVARNVQKLLKNRYNDPTIYKRFVVGIDRAKMRLYDCEQTAQKDILDSGKDEDFVYADEPKIKKSFDGFKF